VQCFALSGTCVIVVGADAIDLEDGGYDSRPGEALGKTDTQLVTGLSLRFD
jgi:hypothetical protein